MLFLNYSHGLLLEEDGDEESKDNALSRQTDHDIKVKRSREWRWRIINPEAKSFNALENYRQLLRSQRWKKNKIEMYRPAYGFGKKKRNADMSFGYMSPYSYGSKFMSNPYSDILIPFF